MWNPVKITGAFRMSSGLYLFTPNCRARTQRKERGMLACWVSIMPATDLPVSPPTLQFTRWLEFTGTSGMCFTTRTQGRLAFVADSWIFRGRSVFFCVFFFFLTSVFSSQQNYLRVAFQDVNSGCTGKTLLVRPYITTEDVCQLCAEKFKVDNPKEYSLFLFVDDTWQQLTEDTYPQKIKAELHSRPQPQVFHFVYKRINSDPYSAIFQNDDSAS